MSTRDEIAIKVTNVSKSFKLPHEKNSSIKSLVLHPFKKRTFEKQEVLKDINFEIKKGEFFGIVGRNGSGKSTLLKLLAGIYSPDKGHIQVNGKLTPFIELGVGFNPELTGRENVFLNGALLGFNRKEMVAMYDEIVEFAELEKFMDQKLKNYSSGMQVRLAFSIAIRAKSDILLLDEVLAVGDSAFQSKCFDYFYKLKKENATVILVSHDRSALERFCENGILINDGEIIKKSNIKEVLLSYSDIVLKELESDKTEAVESRSMKPVEKYATIQNTETLNSAGVSKTKFVYGESIKLSYEVHFDKLIVNPILGVTVWQKNNNKAVFANNTLIDGLKETGSFKKGDRVVFQLDVPTTLNDGEYFVEPAIANESATVFFDQKFKAAVFHISGSANPHSILSSDKRILLKNK